MTTTYDLPDDERYDDESDIDYDTPAKMPAGEADALERASWHMRKAAMLTAQCDQLAAVYKAEIERLQIRLGHRVRIINDQIAWHEEPVKGLHLALLARDPKRKTIELPYGTSKVQERKTPKLTITDQATLLAWAESNHPDILGRTINVTGVKTVAKVTDSLAVVDASTGEVIPGVDATVDGLKWSSLYEQNEEA